MAWVTGAVESAEALGVGPDVELAIAALEGDGDPRGIASASVAPMATTPVAAAMAARARRRDGCAVGCIVEP